MKKNLAKAISLLLVLAVVVTMGPLNALVSNATSQGEPTKDGYYHDYQMLELGDNTVTPQAEGITLYQFPTEETGTYIFTLSDTNAFIGYYGSNEWCPFNEDVLTYTVTVNQKDAATPLFVGVSNASGSVVINISREGDADYSDVVPKVDYVNKVKPQPFTFPAGLNPDEMDYVDVYDSKLDEAILGEDGYYHLNAADGPILFAALMDPMLSLLAAYDYGQLKGATYEGDKLIQVDDYCNAFYEYFAASGGEYDFVNFEPIKMGEGYYPLTIDLITMYKEIGAAQGWYTSTGKIGGTLPDGDAWMFACYYDEAFTSFDADIVVSKIENADKGDTVEIAMPEDGIISGEALEAAKENEVYIKVESEDYTWVIDATTIGENATDVDLNVEIGGESAIPENVLATIENEDVVALALEHEGKFDFTATLSLNLDTKYAGKLAILYYYNTTTGILEESGRYIVATDGLVEFEFMHASDYIIVMNDVVQAPQTGDYSVLVSYGMFFLAGLGLLVFRRKLR